MNQNDVRELKRNLSKTENPFDIIYGAYVNEKKIQDTFEQELFSMEEESRHRINKIFTKVVTSKFGTNITALDVDCDASEIRELLKIAGGSLSDDETRLSFFDRVIAAIPFDETSYMVLVTVNEMDISESGNNQTDADSVNEQSASYMQQKQLIVAVCPIKESNSTSLFYDFGSKGVYERFNKSNLSAPCMGFAYPAFEDGYTNVNRVMYYSKNSKFFLDDFIEQFFAFSKPLLSSEVQQEKFNEALKTSLDDDCYAETVLSAHNAIRNWINDLTHTEDGITLVSGDDIVMALSNSGMDSVYTDVLKKELNDSTKKCDTLSPTSIVPAKDTYDVGYLKFSVSPSDSNRIKVDVVDGRKCLILYADDGVNVNGIDVRL